MSSIVNFNGRRIIEPGVYARIIGTPNITPSPSTSGNVLLIDTGSNATFGGGSGISGEHFQDLNSVYQFSDPFSFKNFVKGGLFWDLADYLFNPSNNGLGAPLVTYIRAATTAAGTITFTFTGADVAPSTTTTTTTSSTTTTSTTLAKGGVFAFKTKDEGVIANGVLDTNSTKVVKGYGAKMFAGVVDTSKFYIEFYLGTFTGLDPDDDPYDGIAADDTLPILITRSIEFDNISDLIEWARTDSRFNAAFKITTTTVTGTGVIGTSDLVTYTSFNLAVGGTESYTSTQVDNVLRNIADLDNSFILCDKWGTDVEHSFNSKILSYINNTATYGQQMFVGGGNDASEYDTYSIDAAQNYNSARTILCHSGIIEKGLVNPSVDKYKGSIYLAALAIGRGAGVEPQISLTYKDLRVTRLQHELNKTQREQSLQAGVFHMKFVSGLGLVVNQAVNTLQRNTQLINPDGTSYSISVMRIADQVNKELKNNAVRFIGNNANQVSPVILKTFTENYLKSRTVTPTQDNLLLSPTTAKGYNVSVQLIETDYFVRYEIIPNSEIAKIFFTGTQIPINVSI